MDAFGTSLIEKIIDYIRLSAKVLRKKVFVLVNLKQYLSQDELQSLYESVFYEKVFLILVSGSSSSVLEKEHHQILDESLCMIEY